MEEIWYKDLSDQELWSRLIDGDEGALAFIYDTWFVSLYRYGMKIQADSGLVKDCIHDLFTSLWHSRQRLSVTDSIKFYLFASLKRNIVKSTRAEGVFRLFSQQSVQHEPHMPSYEERLISQQSDDERNRKLAKVIDKLPKRQKEILYLRYYEGLSTQETAEIMSLSVNSTYVLLSKALNYLKSHSGELMTLIVIWGNSPKGF
ncbi:RNA polymerase sigma factor [Chitinophaga rhizophila]|uniref:Sigma-70 family RNA polymerase sigma factor n=1 Tax=Chitinophaga rhizophila TaxID=2866212 RepID=A0ABS7GFI3_9BACT|nr:sigma-70 family RNA polymerase sigma factor [Chitinophaga rhizophila]MBW8686455.1 sigma-70 family RNA polymerase sigma factor [Chitinophaga rhizophila]